MITTEHECSQEVRGHDKACEKFHLGPPVAVQSYHALETRSTGQEKAPPERRAAAALGAVLLGLRSMRHSTSEPAACASHAAGSTAGRPCVRTGQRQWPSYTVSPAGQRLKRRPRYWEPRKPLAGTRKPRRSANSSGASCAMFGPYWATRKFQPFRSVTQAASVAGARAPTGRLHLATGERPSILAECYGPSDGSTPLRRAQTI